MKRHAKLWPQVVSFRNLLLAFEKAAHGKRSRPDVARFAFDLENELCRLRQELTAGTYTPGPYKTFTLHHPKRRLISAAPFRDRVVHHALVNVLEPIWERTFLPDSYACRKGKGTHAAVFRFSAFARRSRYVLQGDVQKYFPSLDHEVLKTLLARKVKDGALLVLAARIIDYSNPQEPVQAWFSGDDLFTPAARRVGLPLGNQTSQFFANVYLDPLDHFVKEDLGVRAYVRYMDDFALFDDDAARLARWRDCCRGFLSALRLRLHPNKSVIARVTDGCRYLGYRIFPGRRLLPRTNIVRMRRRLRKLRDGLSLGLLSETDVRRSMAGWFGHACHADTEHLQERLLSGMLWAEG
ncbi:MAG: group II intron reverse transcriptase domain-containing protein [Planctomycetes bacterium]|nr:group II intron reverse transcriptase domain-containing protein [Planctomycetota bacterium]